MRIRLSPFSKTRSAGMAAALILASPAGTDLRAASETAVFQDGFDTQALFAEQFKTPNVANWKVEDGALGTVGEGSHSAVLNSPLEGDCKVEADVALLPGTEGGFAGLNLNGTLFLIRPEGFWNVYRNDGDERSSGSLIRKPVEPGRFYHLEVTRRSIDGGWFYSWSVDGEPLGDFSRMMADADPGHLTLSTSRAGARFDNLAVYRVEAGKVSSNTLRNSSFETLQEGLPLYWKGMNTDMLVDAYGSHENFWKSFRADSENPHSGKQSLRIEVNAEVPKNRFQSHNASVARGKPLTYSVWLKADRENLPATLTLWEVFGRRHTKEIHVGTEWKRYSFTLETPDKALVQPGLEFETPGVIWADDAQVEAGTSAGDYAASPSDEGIAQSAEAVAEPVRSFAIPEGTPGNDGVAGREWKGALELGDFRIVETNKAPREKTLARLFADKENLYIAVTCFSGQMNALKPGKPDALGTISSGDCVEVFLDPTGEKKKAYHLFINPDGGTLSMDMKKNLGWNPAWIVKTAKQTDRWEVEVTIPFRSLEGGAARWGINLARHNPHTGEDSCTSLVGSRQFGDVARYDEFTFPASVVFSRPASKAAVKTVPLYPGRNFYMNEPEATVIALLPTAGKRSLKLKGEDGKIVWSGSVEAKAGENRFPVPLKALAEGAYLLELEGGGATRLVKRAFRANAVQVDHHRLCFLVDGKPWFAFAPLVQAPLGNDPDASVERTEKILKYFADAGFRTVSIVSALNAETAPGFWKRLLDYSESIDLKVIAWTAGWTRPYFTPERYTGVMEAIRDHPALLAWCVVDEPELYAKPEQVVEIHEEYRKLDPYHPLVLNYTYLGIPSRFAGLDTDILSIDDYVTNREGRTVAEILDNVIIMQEASRETRKPAMMFLSGANLHNHYREPTAPEQVAQTYGSVIHGVTGTWYFLGTPSARPHWEAYRQLNRELTALTDVLFSGEDSPAIASDQGAVISTVRRHGGKVYLITANIENKPVTAGFRLPDGVKSVEVLFEDRKVEVQEGILRDPYPPYSRHVYVFETQNGSSHSSNENR